MQRSLRSPFSINHHHILFPSQKANNRYSAINIQNHIITFTCIANVQTFIPIFTKTHSIPTIQTSKRPKQGLLLCNLELVSLRQLQFLLNGHYAVAMSMSVSSGDNQFSSLLCLTSSSNSKINVCELMLQLSGQKKAQRTRTVTAGSDAQSWQLPGIASKLLVTTYSTLKIAFIIRSAL